jgi:hypothetical protein
VTDNERTRLTHQVDQALAAHYDGNAEALRAVLQQMCDDGHEPIVRYMADLMLADKLQSLGVTVVVIVSDDED